MILWIDVTYDCNLKCSYCDAYTYERKNTDTDEERYQNILQRLQNFKDIEEVRICGGEPTLFKYLWNLVDYLLERDYRVLLYTNGLKEIPLKYKDKIRLYSSFHLEYPKLWKKVYHNTKDFDTIYNILVREYEKYPNFTELDGILKNDIKVHIQYITEPHRKDIQGTLENYQKFIEYLQARGKNDVFYNEDIAKNYYARRMSICNMNAYDIDGKPECSCHNSLCTYPKCTYTEYQEYHKAKSKLKSLERALLL